MACLLAVNLVGVDTDVLVLVGSVRVGARAEEREGESNDESNTSPRSIILKHFTIDNYFSV